MTAELLDAHRAGRVEVAIGRASDYFGPGATQSALGDTVFGTALTGRTAQVMGNPDLPHSYSYTPDVAAGLITLGTRPGAVGIRLAPTRRPRPAPPARSSTTSTISPVTGPAALPPAAATLTLLGMIKPPMREYLHTLYQFTDSWVVDDSKFVSTFGETATPLDHALDITLQWYTDNAARTTDRRGPLTTDTPTPLVLCLAPRQEAPSLDAVPSERRTP